MRRLGARIGVLIEHVQDRVVARFPVLTPVVVVIRGYSRGIGMLYRNYKSLQLPTIQYELNYSELSHRHTTLRDLKYGVPFGAFFLIPFIGYLAPVAAHFLPDILPICFLTPAQRRTLLLHRERVAATLREGSARFTLESIYSVHGVSSSRISQMLPQFWKRRSVNVHMSRIAAEDTALHREPEQLDRLDGKLLEDACVYRCIPIISDSSVLEEPPQFSDCNGTKVPIGQISSDVLREKLRRWVEDSVRWRKLHSQQDRFLVHQLSQKH